MANLNTGSSVMELLITYHRKPCLKLRNQLVELNIGLVRQVAHRLNRQCSETYEDLEQIGYLGLIRAIERFNPHHGYAFSSFAIPYIKGEMLHYLRDKGTGMRLPRRWQELYTKAQKIRKQLTAELKRPPQDREIAERLAISLSEWYECQLAWQNRSPVSLDATITHTCDSPVSLAEIIPDRDYQIRQNLAEERMQLRGAINQLEAKTRAAIEFVYLRELSRKEAARCIGISPMTVTRHLQKGIEQLGTILELQAA